MVVFHQRVPVLSVVIVQVSVAKDVGDRVLRLAVVFYHVIGSCCCGCAIL